MFFPRKILNKYMASLPHYHLWEKGSTNTIYRVLSLRDASTRNGTFFVSCKYTLFLN
jgi:hypothetical protein